MKTASGSFPLVVSFLLSAAFVPAQDAAPQDPGLTIKQSVQEVQLDVIVRDARGRGVKNLKPGDLEVLEDGVKQEIRAFKLVQGHEVEGKGKGPSQAAATAGANTATNPLKAINLICI